MSEEIINTNKKVSCGTIIVNEHGEILLGKVSRVQPVRFDIPKGLLEDGESPLTAAVRECQEEFGLTLNPANLRRIGIVTYNREKLLYLFTTYMDKASVDLGKLFCSSSFYHPQLKETIPEIDGYMWVHQREIPNFCGPSMSDAISRQAEHIQKEITYGDMLNVR